MYRMPNVMTRNFALDTSQWIHILPQGNAQGYITLQTFGAYPGWAQLAFKPHRSVLRNSNITVYLPQSSWGIGR